MDSKARPLMISIKRSLGWWELLEDWKKANLTPVFKKYKKEDPGNYGQPATPGDVVECLTVEAISTHMVDKRVIRSSQNEFPKDK